MSNPVEKIIAGFRKANTISNMETKKEQRGGAREGSGRKPLKDGVATVPVVTRMTIDQRDKLQRLGGAPWVREKIDKAKEPKE